MLLTKIENENGLKIDFLGETPCSKISFGDGDSWFALQWSLASIPEGVTEVVCVVTRFVTGREALNNNCKQYLNFFPAVGNGQETSDERRKISFIRSICVAFNSPGMEVHALTSAMD